MLICNISCMLKHNFGKNKHFSCLLKHKKMIINIYQQKKIESLKVTFGKNLQQKLNKM